MKIQLGSFRILIRIGSEQIIRIRIMQKGWDRIQIKILAKAIFFKALFTIAYA